MYSPNIYSLIPYTFIHALVWLLPYTPVLLPYCTSCYLYFSILLIQHYATRIIIASIFSVFSPQIFLFSTIFFYNFIRTIIITESTCPCPSIEELRLKLSRRNLTPNRWYQCVYKAVSPHSQYHSNLQHDKLTISLQGFKLCSWLKRSLTNPSQESIALALPYCNTMLNLSHWPKTIIILHVPLAEIFQPPQCYKNYQ